MRTAWAQKLSVRCPKCGAKPGELCFGLGWIGHGLEWVPQISKPHRERRQAFLAHRRQGNGTQAVDNQR